MKDIFDIKRFGKYFLSEIKSAGANFGLSLALLSFMEVIVYLFAGLFSLMNSGQWDGTGIPLRSTTFCLCLFVMVISMPVKCYGHLTDLRSGSTWLMVPASTLEKFLSMVLITAVLIPAVFTGAYFCTDSIICAIDSSCGDSFIKILSDIPGYLNEIPDASAASFLTKLTSPWMYIDDSIGSILIFVLGAICFKKNKSAKTILTLIVISMAASMFMTPFTLRIITDANDPMSLMDSPIIRNYATWDMISDIVIVSGMMVAIYFRIKTLKH